MNILDALILLPIGYFAYKGFMAGLIQEVLSIAGIILGVFVTFAYMKPFSEIIEPYFNSPDTAAIVAGLILFIGTIAIVQTVGYLIRKFLEAIKLNFINRIAGLCFGALKSAIVVSGFLWLFAGLNLPSDETRDGSISYPYVIQLAPITFNMVSTVVPNIDGFIETIKETIEEDNPIRNNPFFE
ncbi:MAG TPA: CvpA family protein [Balneolaceae bacterium]|nr:CvpA family protein [Balneolaceae bacterium]